MSYGMNGWCKEIPGGDTISRAAAIDAVKKNTFRLTFAEEQNCEGHLAWSANAVYSDVIEGALLELPSAQLESAKRTAEEAQNVSDSDLISRKAAIDAIRASTSKYTGFMEMEMYTDDDAVEAIEALPSAQPKAIRPKFVAEDRYRKDLFQIFPRCPKCNYELETGDCYCRVCGCHIDWSEDDE